MNADKKLRATAELWVVPSGSLFSRFVIIGQGSNVPREKTTQREMELADEAVLPAAGPEKHVKR